MTEWRDLSDDELLARLRQRGRADATALVLHRERAAAGRVIDRILNKPDGFDGGHSDQPD